MYKKNQRHFNAIYRPQSLLWSYFTIITKGVTKRVYNRRHIWQSYSMYKTSASCIKSFAILTDICKYIFCYLKRLLSNPTQFDERDGLLSGRYRSVEITEFFCHSDFTWNQFWESRSSKNAVFAILGALNLVDLVNFSLLKVLKVMKSHNSEVSKCAKTADF